VLPVVDAVAELPSLLGPVEDRGAGGEAVGGEEVAGLLVFGLIAAGGELKQEVTEGGAYELGDAAEQGDEIVVQVSGVRVGGWRLRCR
jgi:hypothetical protein